MAITYTREQQISKSLAAAVREKMRINGVVIPSNMRKNVFTTADMDNIDQHKQSNLSKVEFHGTLITLTNHISHGNPGVHMEPLDISKGDHSERSQLPDYYAIVPPAELDYNTDVILEKTDQPVRPPSDRIQLAKAKDLTWIQHASDIILSKGSDLADKDKVTWAGFNSSCMHEETVRPRAVTGVLPMFPDKEASILMIKHTMSITNDAIQFLNPGQTPVLGIDQPIYAIGKLIQWKCHDSHLSENKFVLMLGALHIEFVIEAIEGKKLKALACRLWPPGQAF